MLDAARDDVELPRPELDRTVAELDRQPALQDEEEVVRVGMGVPDELALRPGDLDLVPVVVPDDPRCEGVVERRKLLGEVDLVVHYESTLSICARCSLPE